jgi:hypothetical protein
MQFIITTEMAGGYLPDGDTPPEPFDATIDDAIGALLDEAEFQLGDDWDEDAIEASDLAFIQSLRGHEGHGDLLATFIQNRTVGVGIESYANGFGGTVRLTEVTE